MRGRVDLNLGGIFISLLPDQETAQYDFTRRAVDFQTSAPAEINLRVHCGWFPEIPDPMVVFDSEKGWFLSHWADRMVIRVFSATQDPYQLGVFAPDYRSGDIYVAPSEQTPGSYVFPLSYPMGELYMMNLLGTGAGMLFHAAGIIDRGIGYLFAGQSGAGKTTTARLWQQFPEAQVVNDDKVILRRVDGEFILHGTPWHGEGGMALPDSAPVAAVFVLRQAPANTLTQLAPVQAASNLLARSFIPLWDQEKMGAVLSFLESLTQTIPCYELGFLPDPSAVEFARKVARL